MTDFKGNVIHLNLTSTVPKLVINSMSYMALDAANLNNYYNFSHVLEFHVNISIYELTSNSNAGTIKSKARRPIDYLTLANRWNILVISTK